MKTKLLKRQNARWRSISTSDRGIDFPQTHRVVKVVATEGLVSEIVESSSGRETPDDTAGWAL